MLACRFARRPRRAFIFREPLTGVDLVGSSSSLFWGFSLRAVVAPWLGRISLPGSTVSCGPSRGYAVYDLIQGHRNTSRELDGQTAGFHALQECICLCKLSATYENRVLAGARIRSSSHTPDAAVASQALQQGGESHCLLIELCGGDVQCVLGGNRRVYRRAMTRRLMTYTLWHLGSSCRPHRSLGTRPTV